MGKPTGFMEFKRHDLPSVPVAERVRHFREFILPLADAEVGKQGARCMDCGIPFCHSGCPVNNIIPDWNDLVSRPVAPSSGGAALLTTFQSSRPRLPCLRSFVR